MTRSHSNSGTRREFFKLAATAGAVAALDPLQAKAQKLGAQMPAFPGRDSDPHHVGSPDARYRRYEGETLNRVAFPMGGIGAGMICLEGTGALSHFSLQNHPDLFNAPRTYAAIAIDTPQPMARVLEGPVPSWKIFGQPGSGDGGAEVECGLPRFGHAAFTTRFPFGTVELSDPNVPVKVFLTGWSPFVPGDADSSSLPVAGLEYRFVNPTDATVSATFLFSTSQVFREQPYEAEERRKANKEPDKPTAAATSDGFVLGSLGGFYVVETSESGSESIPGEGQWKDVKGNAVYVEGKPNMDWNNAWQTMLSVPFTVAANDEKTIVVRLSWYVPDSQIRLTGMAEGEVPEDPTQAPVAEAGQVVTDTKGNYKPWYSGRFADWSTVAGFWRDHYGDLRSRTAQFTDSFYDTTLPRDAVESVASNLSIFKSPTMLRQTDGRMWMWEGTGDSFGSCDGSCTHVWNYAQAMSHLFPALERTLRETEFEVSQDDEGHQQFRSALPIRRMAKHTFFAAADGQLGGLMKAYREWRISGDTDWLRRLWPRIKASMDYGIKTWDPQQEGWVKESAHNTYDTNFIGPTSMLTSFYLGALRAATLMGQAVGDDVSKYQTVYDAGVKRAEEQLFNGEYFFHLVDQKQVDETHLAQYGDGCMSDGVLGSWMALVCGVGQVLDADKVRSHLTAVHRHNYKTNLSSHVNQQRPSYAASNEGGLIICTWPRDEKPEPAFPYSDEVWTGIEHQSSSHMMLLGMPALGLDIERSCRQRYDGRIRSPFDEYEAGHWYGRAFSSYAILQGLSGARYDAVDQVLHLTPSVPGDFRSFLCTATGYGTVGVRDGKPFVEVRSGTIDVRDIQYTPAPAYLTLPSDS